MFAWTSLKCSRIFCWWGGHISTSQCTNCTHTDSDLTVIPRLTTWSGKKCRLKQMKKIKNKNRQGGLKHGDLERGFFFCTLNMDSPTISVAASSYWTSILIITACLASHLCSQHAQNIWNFAPWAAQVYIIIIQEACFVHLSSQLRRCGIFPFSSVRDVRPSCLWVLVKDTRSLWHFVNMCQLVLIYLTK